MTMPEGAGSHELSDAEFTELMETSSLGAPGARFLRARTDSAIAAGVLGRRTRPAALQRDDQELLDRLLNFDSFEDLSRAELVKKSADAYRLLQTLSDYLNRLELESNTPDDHRRFRESNLWYWQLAEIFNLIGREVRRRNHEKYLESHPDGRARQRFLDPRYRSPAVLEQSLSESLGVNQSQHRAPVDDL